MKIFMIRLLNLFLILGILYCYQTNAYDRANMVSAHEKQVQKAKELEKEYKAMSQVSPSEEGYVDGKYQGVGTGFGGDIKVEVTIEGHKIKDITVLSAEGEDEAYFSQAEKLLEDIINNSDVECDVISGATFSSKGIIEACSKALEEAQ